MANARAGRRLGATGSVGRGICLILTCRVGIVGVVAFLGGLGTCFAAEPRTGPSGQQTAGAVETHQLPAGAIRRLGTARWRHKSEVCLAKFSPDGKTLATAGQGTTICLWELATGRQIHELSEAGRWTLWGICFSPDGSRLASVHRNGAVRMWSVSTGKQICPSQTHEGQMFERYGIAFAADGKTIATANAHDVRVWNADTLELITTHTTGDRAQFAGPGVAYSRDGELLAASSAGDVYLWNLQENKLVNKINLADFDAVTSLVFCPNSRALVAGGNGAHRQVRIGNRGGGSSAKLAVLDVFDGKRLGDLTTDSFDSGLYSLALSSDGRILVSGHHSEARVWDLEGRKLARIIDESYSVHGGYPCSLDISPDGNVLAARADGNTVGLWEIDSGKLTNGSDGHSRPVTAVACPNNGKLIATLANDESVRLWECALGEQLHYFQPTMDGNGLSTIAIAPNSNLVAIGGGIRLHTGPDKIEFRGNLQVRSLFPGPAAVDTNVQGVIGELTYSADGETLAAATNNSPAVGKADEAILIIAAKNGETLKRFDCKPGIATALAFSADGQTLFSANSDHTLCHWNIKAAQPVHTFDIVGHEPRALSHAAFAPNAKRLISCAMFGKTLLVTEVASGKQLRRIDVANTLGNLLAISADGRILASACQPITETDTRFDERIHLWDLETGAELVAYDGSTDGTVTSLAFLSDGTTLASGMDRGTTLLWDISAVQPKQH